MKKLLGLGLIAIVILFSACSGDESPGGIADGMCDCLQDAGLESSGDLQAMIMSERGRDFQRKAEKCGEEYGAKLRSALEEKKSKKERAKFMKELMKASLDTECADILLEAIPYHLLMENMDEFGFGGYEEKEKYEEEYYDPEED